MESKHIPRVLLTDNDPAYGGKMFQEVLEQKDSTTRECFKWSSCAWNNRWVREDDETYIFEDVYEKYKMDQ